MPVLVKPIDLRTDTAAMEPCGGFTVDDLQLRVRRSARRKTMQVIVERTGELVLCAPPGVNEAHLREFVVEKRFWIYTKLVDKDRLQRPVLRKEFVGGEGFLYLGRAASS